MLVSNVSHSRDADVQVGWGGGVGGVLLGWAVRCHPHPLTPLTHSPSSSSHSLSLLLTPTLQDPLAIYNYVGGATDSVAGNPVMGIAYQAFLDRYGSGTGGMVLMAIPLVCSVLCGTACVTANSRCALLRTCCC